MNYEIVLCKQSKGGSISSSLFKSVLNVTSEQKSVKFTLLEKNMLYIVYLRARYTSPDASSVTKWDSSLFLTDSLCSNNTKSNDETSSSSATTNPLETSTRPIFPLPSTSDIKINSNIGEKSSLNLKKIATKGEMTHIKTSKFNIDLDWINVPDHLDEDVVNAFTTAAKKWGGLIIDGLPKV